MTSIRENSIRVRLSNDEKLRLECNAKTHGCTASELIRRTAVYGQQVTPTIIDMEPIRKMQTELRRQNGSFNQLMRSINTFGLQRHDPKEVQSAIKRTNDVVEEVHSLILDIREGRLNL